MGDDEVRPGAHGLGHDLQRRVDREQHPVHALLRVAGDQTHAVPRLRGRGGVELLEGGDDVGQGDTGLLRAGVHVGPAGLEPTTYAV